jgi:WD40 repeat protein/serine/threonine protein kinase/tetratricopeptide (TPR) repeat protein
MKAEAIFLAALEKSSTAERAAYLDQACAGDPGLRVQVEGLLGSHEQAGSFLEGPLFGPQPTVDHAPLTEKPGSRIGPYKLLEPIGEGGMGVVYMAEQVQPVRRKVALKIIKPGLDTRQVIARFEAERQALALMDHPNIARVLDAGATESGRPYFAMELVRGAPITAYCDRNRLTIEDRLELFIRVCQAVQHAHQKGIIHRDLKPSNVLVTQIDGAAVPKVIDFGVAKAIGQSLTENTLFTGFAQLIGTPLYMSPEQAEFSSVDVDTRSDIYSLGVLLYELLTGTTPFDRTTFRTAGYDEIRRIIREEEPPRPSTRVRTLDATATTASANRQSDPRRLRRSLRGEPDWIVMKCLEKDRNRRYETANGLAADLRRHLSHEPVVAGPPSSWYRVRKAVRRNRAVLATMALVAAALVAVAVVSVFYAREQASATDRITGLAADLRKERKSLQETLAESNRRLAIRNFERGQIAFAKGEIGPGLLWMIESWRSAVDAGDPAWQRAARANLAAWRPHYPRLKAVLSHTRPIAAGAFSPDSRTVISGSLDGKAQLWDAVSGKRIGPPLPVGGQYIHVAFSPDGKAVLTGTEGHTARLWDATTGEPLGPPLRHHGHLLGLAVQPDGRLVLAEPEDNADHIARIWDPINDRPAGPRLEHRGHVYYVGFSPDGKILLTGSADGTARLWDAATGQPIGRPLKHPAGVHRVVLSPDGRTILTGGYDGAARLWDAATGQPIGPPLRHESQVRAVAFSPDSKLILTGCQDKEARLWDAATGRLIALLGHQGGVHIVAFSPDGKIILTGSHDGIVRLWDAFPGQPVGQVLELPSTDFIPGDGGSSPDGKIFVSLPREPKDQRYVQLWNATTRQPIARLPQPGGNHTVEFSPDGKVLLTIEALHTARLWDATTGVALGAAFPLPSRLLPQGHGIRLGPDGKTLLFLGEDQAVWMCDGVTGSVRGHTPILGGVAYELEFSPDGKTFLTGLDNGEVRLWSAATLAPLCEPFPHPDAICHGLFSHDGRSILIACEDGSVWLWDLADRKLLIPPLRHQGPVYGLAFSPDGKTIATGSLDKTARLWDTATGQLIGPVLRHANGVYPVAFSADGRIQFTRSSVSRLFGVPLDLADELERVSTWIEVMTGLRLDRQQGLIQVLDNATWRERRERLMHLGGPPETGPDQRLDPILFGPDPTARARTFMARKQWDAAEAAFDEAVRARPLNIAILVERGDLYASRGLWSEAAAYYATTVAQYSGVAPLHERLAVTRLLAGDRPGYRAACARMLERFKPIDDSTAATRVAYACSLAPEAVADLPGLIQVSERSTRWVASNERGVGAVLFRAGRLAEAFERFERAHKVFEPRAWDWLFLAMIHSGLGQTNEARRWLQRADRWIVEADQAPSGAEKEGPRWSDLTEKPIILLLRREAEASIRYDSIFPADPVAR